MKLTSNYQSSAQKSDNGSEFIISLIPIKDAERRDANLLCDFTVSARINGDNCECNGVLVDQPERGNPLAVPDGGEDDLDLMLNAIWDGDYTSMDEAVEQAFADAISGGAEQQSILEKYVTPIMPMILDKAFSRSEKEQFIVKAILNYHNNN